jgi:ribonuclease HI
MRRGTEYLVIPERLRLVKRTRSDCGATPQHRTAPGTGARRTRHHGAREVSARYPLVAVYADESCLGNGKSGATPGGLGALVEFRKSDGRSRALISGPRSRTPPTIAWRLRSVDRYVSCHVAQGQPAVGAVHHRFALHRGRHDVLVARLDGARMATQGRRGGKRGVVCRRPWRPLRCTKRKWLWVKGHAGHPQNEYANHLATRAAATQDASNGLVPSQFDTWMQEQPPKVRSQPLSGLSVAERFVPSPALPASSRARLES